MSISISLSVYRFLYLSTYVHIGVNGRKPGFVDLGRTECDSGDLKSTFSPILFFLLSSSFLLNDPSSDLSFFHPFFFSRFLGVSVLCENAISLRMENT